MATKNKVIGVIGSAINDVDEITLNAAKEVGRLIGNNGFYIATGTGIGAPHIAVLEAKKQGAKSIGFSPANDKKSHNSRHDNAKISDFDEIRFIEGFTKRSIEMISHCDAIIVIGGRMGTLSEFTIAFEEDKLIGVLTNIPGISKHLKEIIEKCNKNRKKPIFFHEDVNLLFKDLSKYIKNNEDE